MPAVNIVSTTDLYLSRRQLLTRVEDIAVTLDSTLRVTAVKFEIGCVFDEYHVPTRSTSTNVRQ